MQQSSGVYASTNGSYPAAGQYDTSGSYAQQQQPSPSGYHTTASGYPAPGAGYNGTASGAPVDPYNNQQQQQLAVYPSAAPVVAAQPSGVMAATSSGAFPPQQQAGPATATTNAAVQECLVEPPNVPPGVPVASWFPDDVRVAFAQSATELARFSDLQATLATAPELEAIAPRFIVLVPGHQPLYLTATLLSVFHRGCTACPLDPRLTPAQLGAAADQLNTVAAIVTPDLRQLAENAGLRVIVTVTPTPSQPYQPTPVLTWQVPSQAPPPPPRSDNFALLLRTSGTTGRPKVVPITLHQLHLNATAIGRSLNLQPTDVGAGAMPLFHIGGLQCTVLAPLVAASTVIFQQPFEPATFVNMLEFGMSGVASAPSWYYAAPTLHKAVLLHIQHARAGNPVKSNLRFVRSGAAHLPHADAKALHEAFKCAVLPTYSMSECMPICAVPVDWDLRTPDVVGVPISPSLRIGDERGQPLPYGNVGEVLIRGPGVIPGYLNEDPEVPGGPRRMGNIDAGASLVLDGWLPTGDRGVMTRDGVVSLRGRSKEMAKVGGEQVSLHEVDEAIRTHAGVSTVVAFSVANPFWGEEVAVVVVPAANYVLPGNEDAFREDVLRHARGTLEPIKVPKQVVIAKAATDIPRTATGKYLRRDCATAFDVSPVDLAAVNAIAGSSAGFEPSKALYGFRFILALWVAMHHVGDLPNGEWAAIRNFTVDMTGFMLMGGLLLAAATKREIEASERYDFWVSRIGSMHGLFLVACLYNFPAMMVTCAPRDSDANPCKVVLGDGLGPFVGVILFNFVFMGFGFPTIPILIEAFVYGPGWFQGAYYAMLMFFPMMDTIVRGFTNTRLYIAFGVLLGLSTIWMIILFVTGLVFLGFTFVGWLPCFALGVVTWHVIKRNAPQEPRSMAFKVTWGLITDLCSVLFLVICIICATTGGAQHGDDGVTYDEWKTNQTLRDEHSEYSGRFTSPIGDLLGFTRLLTPLVLLYMVGLTFGHGLTAKIFSNRIVVQYISPLAFPLYLLHSATAVYIYYAMGRDQQADELLQAMSYPVQIPWWTLLIIVPVCMFAGALYNEFLNPILIPLMMGYWRRLLRLYKCVCCRCFQNTCIVPDEEDLASMSTLLRVQLCIRRLTGTDTDETSELNAVGLDSFGTTALAGALKDTFPDSKADFAPLTLLRMRTVGDLVAHIDAASGTNSALGDQQMAPR